jgi:SAM-dependent methyltransferase
MPSVSITFHPNDDMLAAAAKQRPIEEAQAIYLDTGARAVALLQSAREIAAQPEPRRILDCPSGYGRVLRHLIGRHRETEFFACDLNREAADFCASEFGAVPIYSVEEPEELVLPAGMDLIWVGSLLTHLSAGDTRAFLDCFDKALGPRGMLAVTFHGYRHIRKLRNRLNDERKAMVIRGLLRSIALTGHGFYPKSGRYGGAYATPDWMFRALRRRGWRLIMYAEGAWGGQDFAAVIKE